MRFGQFLNEYVLARFDLCLSRPSSIAHLEGEMASLSQSLQQVKADNASLRASLAEQDTLTPRFAEICNSTATQEDFLKLARHFSPRTAIGQQKVRVGRDYDGGYIMLDDFEGIAAAFSFGIADDPSWDLEMAGRGIPTYQFDHTIAVAPATHANLKFISRKIVSAPAEDGDTLSELIDRYGEGAGPVLVLKVDIEGDEWAVFETAEARDLRRFAQIVCEFHSFSNAIEQRWYDRALSVMENLSAEFQVVHVHGNNARPLIAVGNVAFPDILEVTFANRARYQFTDCNELIPTALDQPNLPNRPQLFLGRFEF